MKQNEHPLKAYYAGIHERYDRVNHIFTFGRDVVWRRKAAAECLKGRPSRILDLCTGTGDFLLELARQADYPVSLTGYDFSDSMLGEARRKCRALEERTRVRHLELVEGDAARMPFPDASFDAIGITFGIRNLVYENPRYLVHLSEMHRVLKPGGQLVILESSRPSSIAWRWINSLYLRLILPYLGGLISGNLKAYRYLSESSLKYHTMDQMGTILEDSGFSVLGREPLFLGSVMLLKAEKRE
jgi:demethylmenaquinone methyltransferase/2-methoxy-6-polyprenyl-1,4-benzoquinol methylase